MLLRFTSLCITLVLCITPIRSQTLAHPGWRGNGIASQAWWKHASFVRFGPDTTFVEAAHSLDAMSEAGVDSMILPDLQPAADSAMPFNERFGTQDDLDALLREASARRMHVLVGLPVTRLSVGGGEVRFWMTRGISGFDVGSVNAGDLSVLRGVRSAMAHFPGERILIGHAPTSSASAADARRDPIALHTLPGNEAASVTHDAQEWQATEISSWNSPAIPTQNHTAFIFDSQLLQQEGGAAKAHALLLQHTGSMRRSHAK